MSPEWTLDRFGECLNDWEAREQPQGDLGMVVAAWAMSRADDPYAGVQRQPGFGNLWFGQVPGTGHGGRVVTCTYWIMETTRTVRCDNFATLNWPV